MRTLSHCFIVGHVHDELIIETPMNAWLSKEEADALADEIPAGREGTKEEAAQMICMVADAPDYLTGQILTMDGGWI